MFEGLGARLRAYAEKDGRGYPDWALRYVPLVRRLRPRIHAHSRILEVGANENGFSRFTGAPVIAVDIAVEHLRAARVHQQVHPVAADITALPFAAGVFDICACVDTMEHIPSAQRDAAAAEILRVLHASGMAVVTFPAGDPAMRAEQEIRTAYRRFTGRPLHWLEEHVHEGLPDPARVADSFARLSGDARLVTCGKNTSVWMWRWIWRILACGWPGRGNAVFQALLRLLTPALCGIHLGPCYRAVVWVEPRTTSKEDA